MTTLGIHPTTTAADLLRQAMKHKYVIFEFCFDVMILESFSSFAVVVTCGYVRRNNARASRQNWERSAVAGVGPQQPSAPASHVNRSPSSSPHYYYCRGAGGGAGGRTKGPRRGLSGVVERSRLRFSKKVEKE